MSAGSWGRVPGIVLTPSGGRHMSGGAGRPRPRRLCHLPLPALSLLSPPFRGFFLGRLVSLLGSAMTPVALAFAAPNASGLPGDLGVILACQITPQSALLLVGGAAGDRLPAASCCCRHLGARPTQGGVAAVLLTGHYSLPVIAVLEVGNGALEAFASPPCAASCPPRPARRHAAGQLPARLDPERGQDPRAHRGRLLVVGVGGGWAVALDAVSFIAAAAFFVRCPCCPPPRPRSRREASAPADIREARASAPRWVSAMALSFWAINLINVGPWQILGPDLTRQRSGEAAWGLVLSTRAVGLLLMSVLMYRSRCAARCAPAALRRASGLPLLALGLRLALPWLMACAFVGALSFTISGITWDTALEQNVPREPLSRIAFFDACCPDDAFPCRAAAHRPRRRPLRRCPVALASASPTPPPAWPRWPSGPCAICPAAAPRLMPARRPAGRLGARRPTGPPGDSVPVRPPGPPGDPQPSAARKRSPRLARRSGGSLANTSRR